MILTGKPMEKKVIQNLKGEEVEVGLKRGNRRRKNEGMNRKRMILTGKPMEKKVIQNPKGNLRKMMMKIMRKRQKKMVLRKMEKMKSNLKDLQEIAAVGLEINQGNLKKRMIKRNLKMWKSRKRMKVLLRKEITEAIEKTRLILMWILKEEKRKNQGRNPRKGDTPKKSDLGHALLEGIEEETGQKGREGRGPGGRRSTGGGKKEKEKIGEEGSEKGKGKEKRKWLGS